MRISTVYVRFYRAFNFDYLRKHHKSAAPDPWDDFDGRFYPYVKVELDRDVTCVVGANEAGKSQLLDAVEHALGLKEPDPADFCRYSEFFTVSSSLRVPQFGIRLTDFTPEDHEGFLSTLPGVELNESPHVHVFRENADSVAVYVGNAQEAVKIAVEDLRSQLPKSFRINPARPVPDSVPIDYLIKRENGSSSPVPSRSERWSLVDPLIGNFEALRSAVDAKPPNPQQLASLLPTWEELKTLGTDEREDQRRRFDLAFDLLVTVGGVNVYTFEKLQKALRSEDEGFANGIVASINQQLSEALNLHRWWSQDEQFDLQVAARDFDLVFTIKDRTASEYSFAERSSGLKYFLSYLVQYLAHLAKGDTPQLLLMDEPDAFLSNQGQQDLLRLFQDFIDRGGESVARQVMFVTHSPFLIDKNHAERVRVLDKGADDEGTRVVRDVGRNHFEPLRSAFGSFVGETAFIGNCNVMLEGVSDQVYLAGMSSVLLRLGATKAEYLNLNEITLAPAGSASHIPYMTFLARGRDVDQPAVVVLLDGDKAGDDARKALERGLNRKQLLDSKFILQITDEAMPGLKSERPGGPRDIEDLVSASLLISACEQFVAELGINQKSLPTAEAVVKLMSESTGSFKALEQALKEAGSKLRPDKIALARHVVQVLEVEEGQDADRARSNFKVLFLKIGELQRLAVHERSRVGVGRRVDRLVATFISDHPATATRSDLKILLDKVEALLDSTPESEEIRKRIRVVRNEQKLTADLSQQLTDLLSVTGSLKAMKYAGTIASQDDGKDIS